MNTNQTETQAQSEPQVHSSALLEVLRKYWNERINRKKARSKEMADLNEYAAAQRFLVEAEATELCLLDLESESTSNTKITNSGANKS